MARPIEAALQGTHTLSHKGYTWAPIYLQMLYGPHIDPKVIVSIGNLQSYAHMGFILVPNFPHMGKGHFKWGPLILVGEDFGEAHIGSPSWNSHYDP